MYNISELEWVYWLVLFKKHVVVISSTTKHVDFKKYTVYSKSKSSKHTTIVTTLSRNI